MPSALVARYSTVGVLLVALIGLMVWYGALPPNPDAGVYPDNEALAEEYDRYIDQRVTVAGTVVDTEPLVIEEEIGPRRTLRLSIRGAGVLATEGDELWVYGTALEGRVIDTENAIVVQSGDKLYTYGVSILAGLWVLIRVVRHWQLDRSDGSLTRRGTGGFGLVVFRQKIDRWRPGGR